MSILLGFILVVLVSTLIEKRYGIDQTPAPTSLLRTGFFASLMGLACLAYFRSLYGPNADPTGMGTVTVLVFALLPLMLWNLALFFAILKHQDTSRSIVLYLTGAAFFIPFAWGLIRFSNP